VSKADLLSRAGGGARSRSCGWKKLTATRQKGSKIGDELMDHLLTRPGDPGCVHSEQRGRCREDAKFAARIHAVLKKHLDVGAHTEIEARGPQPAQKVQERGLAWNRDKRLMGDIQRRKGLV
jgi:hypothetical protein